MSASSIHADLRAATARQHEAVETDADVEARLRDLEQRPHAVRDLKTFHEAVERGVAPWSEAIAGQGYPLSSRADLIPGDADPTEPADRPASLGEALGWIYVAEGSMLGGRAMRLGMRRDGIPLDGLEFLDPYGDGTGPRWRAFLDTLDSACASGRASREDVLKGGADAFDLAYRLLVPSRRDDIA